MGVWTCYNGRFMLPRLMPLLALTLTMACSADTETVCRGRIIECHQPGYFPLCDVPEEKDADREADGLFCVNNEGDDFSRTYIGPTFERASGCDLDGNPLPCSAGNAQCVFLPGCTEEDLAGL